MAVAVPLMCCAADMISVPSRKQVVLVGSKSSPELNNMLSAAHSVYDPNKTVRAHSVYNQECFMQQILD